MTPGGSLGWAVNQTANMYKYMLPAAALNLMIELCTSSIDSEPTVRYTPPLQTLDYRVS